MGNYCSRCRNFMGGKYTLIINVLNKDLVPVTFIDNDIPGLPSYYKDTLIDYLSLGTASFEFTILKSKNNIIQDYSRFFNDETCFSFEKNGKQYAVFPAGSDGFYETDTEITYKCLSLDRELSLEYVDKFDNSSTHTLQWYIDYFELISNNQIEIGRNDVADYTRVIKYDSQDTKLNRLLSLINNFDAEFEFITKLTNNGAVDKIILNIVKKRDDSGKGGIGAIRDDVELVYGKNVKGIERTYNFEFFNASKVIGKDGTNWNSSEFSYINSDGVEEFYKRKNDDTAFAPLSAQKYPAHLRKDSSDIWLRKNFETEYTTPAQMWGYIVQQFKSYAYPQITYKIKTNSNLVSQALDGKLPIQIGDTVTIEDDNFSNEQGDFGLILRARATEIKSSDSNPETNEITFENFVELQNDLSDDLMTQVNQLVDAATPYRAELTTTNGTQFKNGTGSTTLSAHIFKGSATAETIADSYEWSKDGTIVAPTQTITVDASGVTDKAVYSFKATVAGKVVANQSVTITNVDDGTNGRSVTNVSQKWRLTTTTATPTQAWSDAGWLTTQPTTTATNKYLWSITRTTFNLAPLTQDVIEQKAVYGDKGDKGDTGNDGRAGKDGVGLRSTTVTYTISSSGTVTPTAGWNSQVPTLVKGQYLWTKTVWTYTDNSSETGYSVTYIAKDGNNGNDGIAGKDGVGIKTTTITYAGSTSGTTAPTDGWTSTVPTVAAGSYLWTKTLWTYTDNSFETGYSVAKMGNNGTPGPQGPPGSNGDPGKIVSDTEPSTRFKGLTWKYSGTTDLTASDGTVIKPNTEYYYNGTHWMINYLSANNLEANSITADLIDAKNLTITDGEFISKTTNGPVTTSTEIKDNHIAISKTDGTVNTRNDIALDSEQGLAQKFTNINTGFYRTAGINYQGPFTSDSDGNYAQLTPQGTKLSTDVPWTTLSTTNGFSGGLFQFSVQNRVEFFSISGLGVPQMNANQWYQATSLPAGSSAIPSVNRVYTISGNNNAWDLLINPAGGIFIRCQASVSATSNLVNGGCGFPIG
ncbi:putative receptor binding protein [Lactococcus phage 56701]|nr:putative receptor binding protein [Lactococcus phage 56701]